MGHQYKMKSEFKKHDPYTKPESAGEMEFQKNVKFRLAFFYSITFKNLVIFLVIFLAALGPLAYSYWVDIKKNHIDSLARQLEIIANQAVKKIDPILVQVLERKEFTGTEPHTNLVNFLKEIQVDFNVDNVVVMKKHPNGKFYFIADGNNQFFVTQDVFLHERFPETLKAANGAWENTGRMNTGLFGFGTYEYLQFNEPIVYEGKVIAILMVNKFAEDVDQAIQMDAINVLLMSVAILLLGWIFFWTFSTKLLRPLVRLRDATYQVAEGNLDIEIDPIRGRDEISQLNESFRVMVREVRSSRLLLEKNNRELKRTIAKVQLMEDLENNLSKFVPQDVRKALRIDPEALEKGKIEEDVTVLFLDVEGSTLLIEVMEPEVIDDLIQDYFSKYLDCIYENNGDITETAGDGLMIIFRGEISNLHAFNAVKTALTIQTVTQVICEGKEKEEDCLKINIGINSGSALVGFSKFEAISGTRITFTATGRTTILAARLQDIAKNGSIVISTETMERVKTQNYDKKLIWNAEDLGEIELKNLINPGNVFRIWRSG